MSNSSQDLGISDNTNNRSVEEGGQKTEHKFDSVPDSDNTFVFTGSYANKDFKENGPKSATMSVIPEEKESPQGKPFVSRFFNPENNNNFAPQ